MTKITINTDLCVKCGHCARVCPPHIFMQLEKHAPIRVVKAENCILCGHCVDVCPVHAIEHSEIPYEKVHKVDYHNMPTPEQMMNLFHARRSNRTFTDRNLQPGQINQIIEAGYYAPTAVNNCQVKIKLISDQKVLNEVRQYVVDTFTEHTNDFRKGLIKAASRGKDPILRDAHYLMIFTSNHPMGIRDAQLAYQNSSLMAQTLGISQVYMGYVIAAYEEGNKQQMKDILGVEDEIQAVMALGIPAFRYANYTERF